MTVGWPSGNGPRKNCLLAGSRDIIDAACQEAQEAALMDDQSDKPPSAQRTAHSSCRQAALAILLDR